MSASTVTQIFEHTQAQSQSGDGVVAQATVNFDGSDALLGFSGSAWTQTAGEISLQVWLDGEPLGTALAIYANTAQMHMSLGRMWVHAQGVSAGQHKLMVVAGMSTITDVNDWLNLTLWQLGDGLAVRATADLPCPAGSGQTLLTERFRIRNGAFLMSGSGSGWVTGAGALVQTTMLFDRGDGLMGEVYANNANQHLATVPVDNINPNPQSQRGEYELQLVAQYGTSTDQGDIAHLTVVEWVNAAAAPVEVELNPPLMDTAASAQQGGEYVAQSSFQSGGGTLLFRVSMSGWTPQAGVGIGASIEIDGTSMGNVELFANFASTHLAIPSNDLVVSGIPAGTHSFQIQSGAYTYTDGNDRVGVLALEFPKAAAASY
jgi:hypothetical protein